MKKIKRKLSLLLAVVLLLTLLAGMAEAAGTVAYGAGTISASVLNIRKGPGTTYAVQGTVSKGKTVVVLEKSGSDWYKINYDGKVGYVSAQYVKSVSVTASFVGTGKVNDSDVRYRKSAGTSGAVIGSIPKGTSVKLTGIDNGWYQLSYNGKTGYMRSDYIDVISVNGEATEKAKESDTPKEDAIAAIVTADYVNFRTNPSTDSSIIRTLNKNAEITILSKSGNWYKIIYNGVIGYMSSSYVAETSAEKKTEPQETKTEQKTEVKAEVKKEEEKKEEKVYTGSVTEMSEEAVVSGKCVNFRKGPDTTYASILCLNKGTKVQVTGKVDGWYQVKYNGSTGFMSASYVTLSKDIVEKSLGEEIAEYTRQFKGYKYVYGGATPSGGFDCSGLVYYVYGQFGYSIPHGATSQYKAISTYVNKSDLQPGDLVFFSNNGFKSITHVGLYLGNGEFIHASGTNVGVIISDINSSWYSAQYYGAKRVIS